MNSFDPPLKGLSIGKKRPTSDEPDLFSITSLPATPYPDRIIPTAGHSGTATSEARAIEEVANGKLTERHLITISCLEQVGTHGLNWQELDEAGNFHHHGRTSSALTSLHKMGRIARLTEVRNGSLVYVLDRYVDGREVSPITDKKCVCGKPMKVSYNYCPKCGLASQATT